MNAPTTTAKVYVRIESIRVVDRHRKDVGDVSELAASIADVDLLHPIVLTPDSRLIAGQRRLEACRQLGWTEVPVHFVDRAADVAVLLRAERDENVCRKDMLPSELASLGAALHAIEEKRAAERMRNGQDRGRAVQHELVSRTDTGDQLSRAETVDVVGPALGMAGRTYQELRFVHGVAHDPVAAPAVKALAEDTLAEMDRTGAIAPPARRLRARLRAKEEAAEAKAAALSAPGPETQVNGARRSRSSSVAERFARMRELAASGHTSHQIAEILAYSSAATVRETARQHEIAIPADVAMGRSHRRVDSNRIVRETAQALDGLLMGIDLVRLEDLDRIEAATWATSLTDSLRILNRFAKQIKEITQ